MSKVQFSVQVRLVSNLERSKEFYATALSCEVNDWWAVRDCIWFR
ncbi:VOC family protein [Paenibacillus sp. FSL E2-8871]